MGSDDGLKDPSEMPTHRESGHLAVFEQTAVESLAKLESLPEPIDDEVRELKAEAVSLLGVFRSWATEPPIGEERARAIERVMDLHRNVESFLAGHR
jgi:hypothetical protein